MDSISDLSAGSTLQMFNEWLMQEERYVKKGDKSKKMKCNQWRNRRCEKKHRFHTIENFSDSENVQFYTGGVELYRFLYEI